MSPEAGWLLVNEIVPRLRSAVPQVCQCVGAEDTQELVADATCHAARILHSAEARGKKITPGNACFYAIEHTRSGRRSVGNSCVDVMGTGTQINGRSRLDSLEMVVASNEESGGEIFELHDVLGSDEEDPGTKAARKMDWETFLAGLSAREQAVIECLVDGRSLRNTAKCFQVCDSTVQGDKRKLAVKIQEFMGFDILVQVQRKPSWKNDLVSAKEKMACREERKH